MPRPHAKPLGEHLHAAIDQAAFADQAQGPRNCTLRSCPSRGSRRTLRAATQARPKPGFGGCGSRRKIAGVLLHSRGRGPNVAARYSPRADTDVELAIKA